MPPLRRRRIEAAVSVSLTLLAAPPAVRAQAGIAPPAAPAPMRAPLTAHQHLARAVYQELVEINTTEAEGSTTRAAEAMARRFRAAGFPAGDVRVLVPAGRPRKGNLVVRYRGRGVSNGFGAAGKPILLLAHLDVVAAKRSDWPRDPFTFTEEGGYFLGRGVADDKAMAAIFVANLLRWKREGYRPDRDVVLALTADEEGGPDNGVQWLLANHRALIDADYALNEGGGGGLRDGKPLQHTVQAAEKYYADFTLTATNTGGHSSVPRADNAIYALAGALGRIAAHRFPVQLNEVSRTYFARSAALAPPATAAAMRALVANPADSAAAATLAAEPRWNAMLRTTCVATMLDGGHAPNALPQTATATVNCRIVPTQPLAEVRATLERLVGDTAVRVSIVPEYAGREGAPPSPLRPEVMDAVGQITAAMWGPEVPVVPVMSTGATDGRLLRAAGIPTYGVSGLFSHAGETNAHGRDEKMRVHAFYEGLEFLDRLVRRLAGAPRA